MAFRTRGITRDKAAWHSGRISNKRTRHPKCVQTQQQGFRTHETKLPKLKGCSLETWPCLSQWSAEQGQWASARVQMSTQQQTGAHRMCRTCCLMTAGYALVIKNTHQDRWCSWTLAIARSTCSRPQNEARKVAGKIPSTWKAAHFKITMGQSAGIKEILGILLMEQKQKRKCIQSHRTQL